MSKGIGGHQSAAAKFEDWCTPPEIIDALGPFDLDPCAAEPQPFRTAETMWTAGGLDNEWFGRVWLNPPYGRRDIGNWMRRLALHGNGTALVFARTETAWFHKYVWGSASSVFFLRGRLNFYTPGGVRSKKNAGAPSCLVSYDSVHPHGPAHNAVAFGEAKNSQKLAGKQLVIHDIP